MRNQLQRSSDTAEKTVSIDRTVAYSKPQLSSLISSFLEKGSEVTIVKNYFVIGNYVHFNTLIVTIQDTHCPLSISHASNLNVIRTRKTQTDCSFYGLLIDDGKLWYQTSSGYIAWKKLELEGKSQSSKRHCLI